MTSSQLSDKDILVIKATIKNKDISGIICIVASGASGEIYSLDCAIANQPDTSFPKLSLSISDFEKTLTQYKKQYIINSQFTILLQDTLRVIFSPQEVKRIYNINDKKEQKKEIFSILLKVIKDITKQDGEINCEITQEDEYKKEKTQKEENKLKDLNKDKKIQEDKKVEEKEKDTTDPEIYLKIQLAVETGKGKTVFDLCKGDKLLVKIVDDRPFAEYVSSLLLNSKSQDGSYLYVPVIKAEDLGDNKYRLLVKFGPGVFGETIIPPSIKIKTIKEEDEKQKTTCIEPKADTFVITPLIFFQSVIFVLLIALIIFAKIIQ